MKNVLAVLLTLIVLHAPWRLMALAGETMVIKPGIFRQTHTSNRYWDVLQLEARLLGMGWSVTYTQIPMIDGDQVYGMTDFKRHAIVLDERLQYDARLNVLAHEAGHTLEPAWLSANEGEVFAEAVSMLIADDGIREHARYLARHKVDTLVVAIVEWRTIYHAAAVLEDR